MRQPAVTAAQSAGGARGSGIRSSATPCRQQHGEPVCLCTTAPPAHGLANATSRLIHAGHREKQQQQLTPAYTRLPQRPPQASPQPYTGWLRALQGSTTQQHPTAAPLSSTRLHLLPQLLHLLAPSDRLAALVRLLQPPLVAPDVRHHALQQRGVCGAVCI